MQNYKRYLAGRQQPLFKQLESDFAAKEKEHVREKVEEYNSSLRPPKLKTVRLTPIQDGLIMESLGLTGVQRCLSA